MKELLRRTLRAVRVPLARYMLSALATLVGKAAAALTLARRPQQPGKTLPVGRDVDAL